MAAKQIEIQVTGSLYTYTTFQCEDGVKVRIKVWLENAPITVANQLILYRFQFAVKKTNASKWVTGNACSFQEKDEMCEFFGITDQEIYIAMHNHWNERNPLFYFGKGQVNGVVDEFSVERLTPDTVHYIKPAKPLDKY